MVKMTPGRPTIDQFDTPHLNQPMPLIVFQAGGFGIQYDNTIGGRRHLQQASERNKRKVRQECVNRAPASTILRKDFDILAIRSSSLHQSTSEQSAIEENNQ